MARRSFDQPAILAPIVANTFTCYVVKRAATRTEQMAPIYGYDGARHTTEERRASHFEWQRLCRSHLPRRPDRQLQYLAKRAQICIPWSNVIRFPKIDARRADADLFGYFSDR